MEYITRESHLIISNHYQKLQAKAGYGRTEINLCFKSICPEIRPRLNR
jgi:hypothetical protein